MSFSKLDLKGCDGKCQNIFSNRKIYIVGPSCQMWAKLFKSGISRGWWILEFFTPEGCGGWIIGVNWRGSRYIFKGIGTWRLWGNGTDAKLRHGLDYSVLLNGGGVLRGKSSLLLLLFSYAFMWRTEEDIYFFLLLYFFFIISFLHLSMGSFPLQKKEQGVNNWELDQADSGIIREWSRKVVCDWSRRTVVLGKQSECPSLR